MAKSLHVQLFSAIKYQMKLHSSVGCNRYLLEQSSKKNGNDVDKCDRVWWKALISKIFDFGNNTWWWHAHSFLLWWFLWMRLNCNQKWYAKIIFSVRQFTFQLCTQKIEYSLKKYSRLPIIQTPIIQISR